MRNIRLLIQYEGTRYQGWQRQSDTHNTLQEKFEQLLTRMCKESIEITASGRTDAGVHALGQVANFHTNSLMSTREMLEYINQYLPEDVAVTAVAEAAPRFHSRLNAVGKCYRYLVLNSNIPDVFYRKVSLMVPEPLCVDEMRRAADSLCGEHDFQSFTSAKKGKKSTVRRIDSIEITENYRGHSGLMCFTFKGNGFLHHMVRILMGTLLEVGAGKKSPEDMDRILQSKNRKEAGTLVPAKGLTLMEVYYN